MMHERQCVMPEELTSHAVFVQVYVVCVNMIVCWYIHVHVYVYTYTCTCESMHANIYIYRYISK